MSVRSVERAISVLDCFEPAKPSLSLHEICTWLKLPKTTTFRILQSLVDAGYVINTDDGRFELSLKVLRLANSVRVDTDIVRLARPALDEVAQKTGEAVALSALDGNDRVILDVAECTLPLKLVLKRGERHPRDSAATGIVFLAYDEAALADYLAAHPDKAKATKAAVEKVRKNGYSVTTDFRVKGSAGVAAPIFDIKDRCTYSIGVYGPASRVIANLASIVEVLVPQAQKVSRFAGSRRAGCPVR